MVDKKVHLSNWIKEGVKLSDTNIGIIKTMEGKCKETRKAVAHLIKVNDEKFQSASNSVVAHGGFGGKK